MIRGENILHKICLIQDLLFEDQPTNRQTASIGQQVITITPLHLQAQVKYKQGKHLNDSGFVNSGTFDDFKLFNIIAYLDYFRKGIPCLSLSTLVPLSDFFNTYWE